MSETDAKQIVGISLLVAAMILQIVCLLLTRILVKLEYGGYIAVMRTWLFLSSTMENVFNIILHVRYTYLQSYDEPDTCIVLRFLTSFCSTFTTMWMLAISAFYLVMTIKPEKCFTSLMRFLTYCVALTWTFGSCLFYLVLAFLLEAVYKVKYIKYSCWQDISNTLHMFNCYGNEIIPFLVTAVIIVSARYRISTHYRTMSLFTRTSDYHVDVIQLRRTIYHYIFLIGLLFIYYIGLYIRFVFDKRGSDVVLMAMQCGRGVAIAVTVCLLDNDVLSVILRRPFSIPRVILAN